MMAMKILCSGNIAIDYYQSFENGESLPDFSDNTVIRDSVLNNRISLGGKGMNFANAFSYCGLETWMHGSVGRDKLGALALHLANGKGINTSLVSKLENPTMLFAVNMDANNTIPIKVHEQHASLHLPTDNLTEEILNDFTCVVAHATSAWDDLIDLFDKLEGIDGKVVFSASPGFNLKNLLPLYRSNLIVVNKIEAHTILNLALGPNRYSENEYFLAQQIANFFNRDCIVTLGEKGVVAAYNGQAWYCPIRPVQLVDTVGAGDSFLGFTVAALLKGALINEAIRVGQTAASLVCEVRGAATINLSYEKVLVRIDETPKARPLVISDGAAYPQP